MVWISLLNSKVRRVIINVKIYPNRQKIAVRTTPTINSLFSRVFFSIKLTTGSIKKAINMPIINGKRNFRAIAIKSVTTIKAIKNNNRGLLLLCNITGYHPFV